MPAEELKDKPGVIVNKLHEKTKTNNLFVHLSSLEWRKNKKYIVYNSRAL